MAVKNEVEGVDTLTLEVLAEMEQDEIMRDTKLPDLLELLGHSEYDIRERATRELVRRGTRNAEVQKDTRAALRDNDPEVRFRARYVLYQIEKEEEREREEEYQHYMREAEMLENEALRHGEEAESCKDEAAQYDIEAEEWRRAHNEEYELKAHERSAGARREAGEEIRQIRRTKRDVDEARLDADDAKHDIKAERKEERKQRSADRKLRRDARRYEDLNRDRIV